MSALRAVATVLFCTSTLWGCAHAPLNAPRPADASEERLKNLAARIDLDNGKMALATAPANENYGAWVDHAVSAIRTYYGRFPTPHAQLLIEQVDGSGVQWARTFSQSGFFVRVGIGNHTTATQLDADWMLTHEFVHLTLPTFADEHDWLQEGAATYIEPIARAYAGQLSPERVWAGFMRQMPSGLPRGHDKGLDQSKSWERTYWGGALFCLYADVEIRKRTDNQYGLRDALRAILEDGGTLDHRWSIIDALSTGDRATGVSVLTQMYEQWRAKPVRVDLEEMWRELGVVRDGRKVVLDERAPLAHIRRAISSPPTIADDSVLSLLAD